MPSSEDLRAIRASVAQHHRRLHRIVTATTFTRTVGSLGGEQLTRVPRGYPKDHPAAEYLRHKQFVAGCEFPADFALSARFYRDLLRVFRAVSPLVDFLNTAIIGGRETLHGPAERDFRQFTRSLAP
jgi:uncharacterized protein (DUF2461 family)